MSKKKGIIMLSLLIGALIFITFPISTFGSVVGEKENISTQVSSKKNIPKLSGEGYKSIDLYMNDKTDLSELFNIKADDIEDGNISDNVVIDDSKVDYDKAGLYPVVFSVTDSDGNNKSLEADLEVLANLIAYRTHVQNVGWQTWRYDGQMSGTIGQSLRLEGIEIKVTGIQNLGISYSTHVQNIGWQDWKFDGAMSGTSGQSLRLEAIRILLTGTAAGNYDVYYRVHAQDYGWLDWAKNGEASGTEGMALRLEGIEVKIVAKGSPAPGSVVKPFVSKYGTGKINYSTHIENIGWQEWKSDGVMSGTSGKALRLEAIMMRLGVNMTDGTSGSGGIRYMTHIQNIGWQDWRYDGQLSGTSGLGLRLEAIRIELTGKFAADFDIYYRVHIQNYGWLGWAKNGQDSGSLGLGMRLEGIEVMVVPKQ